MKKRESGIDLIKIIMMLWIVMFHMANHSMVDLISSPLSASWIFEAFCKIGGGGGGLYIRSDYGTALL